MSPLKARETAVDSVNDPCSITAARDLVRTINGKMTGDIVVQFADGVYAMTQPGTDRKRHRSRLGQPTDSTSFTRQPPAPTRFSAAALRSRTGAFSTRRGTFIGPGCPPGPSRAKCSSMAFAHERARGELPQKAGFKSNRAGDAWTSRWPSGEIRPTSRSSRAAGGNTFDAVSRRSKSTKSHRLNLHRRALNRASRHPSRFLRRRRSRLPGSI